VWHNVKMVSLNTPLPRKNHHKIKVQKRRFKERDLSGDWQSN